MLATDDAFEIIQSDGNILRFEKDFPNVGCSYFYELSESGVTLKVFMEDENSFTELIATIFNPIRVDSVDVSSMLSMPIRGLGIGQQCENCGFTKFPERKR